jgi:hypothetical protein
MRIITRGIFFLLLLLLLLLLLVFDFVFIPLSVRHQGGGSPQVQGVGVREEVLEQHSGCCRFDE